LRALRAGVDAPHCVDPSLHCCNLGHSRRALQFLVLILARVASAAVPSFRPSCSYTFARKLDHTRGVSTGQLLSTGQARVTSLERSSLYPLLAVALIEFCQCMAGFVRIISAEKPEIRG
jgi:hypothetical protein